MKAARVIITTECLRACPDCCNRQPGMLESAKPIGDISDVSGYDEVLITGGEPTRDADRLVGVLARLRAASDATVYLYAAAYYSDWLPRVWEYVDGVQFSVHDLYGLTDFYVFQKALQSLSPCGKSIRLAVEPSIHSIRIMPALYSSIRVLRWVNPCPLPAHEALFILRGER